VLFQWRPATSTRSANQKQGPTMYCSVMQILLTGAEGFVGRHFSSYFRERGDHVVAVDIKSGIDCRDFFRTSTEKFDLIVHLAAIVGGRETIESQPLSVATDLSIDAELFNWAVSTGQERILYYSSSAAYPKSLQTLALRHSLKEEDIDLERIQNPDMTYGWSKLTGEYLAHFARQSGMKVHVLRPFSGYGWDQDETYPFPAFVDRAIRKADPFEIWGSGNQVRDFIHISDVIEATMKAVELEIEVPLNLGRGVPVSFLELARMVFKVSGWKPESGVQTLPHKPEGVEYRCADISQMKKVYTPKISLEEGIAEALERRPTIIRD
jgi:nucleoside-diphosphate-sugar epimerase